MVLQNLGKQPKASDGASSDDTPMKNMFQTQEHDDKTYLDLSLIEESLVGHSFENCVFIRCNMNGVNLSRSRLISCKFDSCDLSNAVVRNGRFRDTDFSNCKLMGIQWVHLDDLTNPSFQECILQYCNFSGLKLKKTRFFKNDLREADFSMTDLTEADLRESDFIRTRFNETTLNKADFRGAFNYLIDPLKNKIRGARFSLPEAQGLLAGLGVIID